MKAQDVLRKAAEVINERGEVHGGVERTHAAISDLWSAYLTTDITQADVARMMALMKIARASTGATHLDHDLDGAAYLAIAAELSGAE